MSTKSTLEPIDGLSPNHLIPWEAYTWKSHHKASAEKVETLMVELERAKLDCARTQRELERAQDLGVENDPLPADYGVRLLSIREGMVCPAGPAEETDR